MSFIIFLLLGFLGLFIFSSYTILLTRQRDVKSARSAVVTLEMVRAELSRDPSPSAKVQEALATTERELPLAKMALRSAIVRYNDAVRGFPTNIVATLRGFDEDRSHIK